MKKPCVRQGRKQTPPEMVLVRHYIEDTNGFLQRGQASDLLRNPHQSGGYLPVILLLPECRQLLLTIHRGCLGWYDG